jgi:hypothetical protein
MAFWAPFMLGAAAVAAGLHVYKNRKDIYSKLRECSCGCGDKCECDSDCDCGCNAQNIKRKAFQKADFALEKVKNGLHTIENNITEENMDKIKGGLKTVGDKISEIQTKFK